MLLTSYLNEFGIDINAENSVIRAQLKVLEQGFSEILEDKA